MTTTRSSLPLRQVLLGMVAAMLVASSALAQSSVAFKIDRREAWVGQPFTLQVEVMNAEDHQPPVVPEIDGADIELLDQTKESSFTQIVNGRVSRRVTVIYTIVITPLESGVLEIPSIGVVADGTSYSSRPWRITASRSEVGDLMLVEVIASPEDAWIGEAVDLTLQVWLKQYRDPELGMALDEGRMWERLDESSSTWGIFTEAIQQLARERRRPRGRKVDRDGVPYLLFEIPVVRHPIQAGDIDVGDVRVVYSYPTGMARKRDFFGNPIPEVTSSRPIMVVAERPPVVVRSLPEEGRPPGFTGAVGRFRILANATPRDVSVGDPITITIEITDVGDGSTIDLANLRPPDLRSDPMLEGFRIPDTPTTGIVEGRTKTFTETLRPERDDLTSIPGIAFPTFDPDLDRYVVERTEPMEITVNPSETLDLDSSVIGADPARGPAASRLTATEGTLRANRTIDSAMLPRSEIGIEWPVACLIVLPPVGCAFGAVARKRRRHRDRNPHLTRALQAGREARAILDGEGTPAERVHRALTGMVASRLHRPDAAMTPREILESTRVAGLDASSLEELEAVLHAAETARYAAASGRGQASEALLDRARALIEPLDGIQPTIDAGEKRGDRS